MGRRYMGATFWSLLAQAGSSGHHPSHASVLGLSLPSVGVQGNREGGPVQSALSWAVVEKVGLSSQC